MWGTFNSTKTARKPALFIGRRPCLLLVFTSPGCYNCALPCGPSPRVRLTQMSHPRPSSHPFYCCVAWSLFARLFFPAGGTNVAETAATGQATATALSQALPSPLSPHHSTPNGAGNSAAAAATQATATGGRCQAETDSRNSNGTRPGEAGGAATGTAQEGASGGAGAAAAAGGSGSRSLVPSPPGGPGPATFASPAVTTAVVQQPLGHKVAVMMLWSVVLSCWLCCAFRCGFGVAADGGRRRRMLIWSGRKRVFWGLSRLKLRMYDAEVGRPVVRLSHCCVLGPCRKSAPRHPLIAKRRVLECKPEGEDKLGLKVCSALLPRCCAVFSYFHGPERSRFWLILWPAGILERSGGGGARLTPAARRHRRQDGIAARGTAAGGGEAASPSARYEQVCIIQYFLGRGERDI